MLLKIVIGGPSTRQALRQTFQEEDITGELKMSSILRCSLALISGISAGCHKPAQHPFILFSCMLHLLECSLQPSHLYEHTTCAGCSNEGS